MKFEYTFYIGFVYLFFKLYIDIIEKVAPQNYFSPDILCVDHALRHKVSNTNHFFLIFVNFFFVNIINLI